VLAFVRTNPRAIAIMFVRLSGYSSGRLSETGVHCDHSVHFSADLSLRLDSSMFWGTWHQRMSTYSQLSFPVLSGGEVGYGCATAN